MFVSGFGICDEAVESHEIFTMVTQCVLYDKDNAAYAPVVASLVSAWVALYTHELAEQGKEFLTKMVSGAQAEKIYQDAYSKIYADNDCWWPEALPFDSPLPVMFITSMAQGIARSDCAATKAYFAQVQKDSLY